MVCVIFTDWLGVGRLLKVILGRSTICPGAAVVLEVLLIISRQAGPHEMLVSRPNSRRVAQRFAIDLLGPEGRSVVTAAKTCFMKIKPDVSLLVISVRVAGGGEVGDREMDVLLLIENVLVTESGTGPSKHRTQPKQPQIVEIIFYKGSAKGEGWVDGSPEGCVCCHVGEADGDRGHEVV